MTATGQGLDDIPDADADHIREHFEHIDPHDGKNHSSHLSNKSLQHPIEGLKNK